MKYRDFKIKTKLAIFVSSILSFTVLICMVIADRISFDLLRDQKIESVQQEAQNKAHLTYEHLISDKNDVLLLSRLPRLRQFIELKTQMQTDSSAALVKEYHKIYQELVKLYAEVCRVESNYFKIRYIDETGQEIIHIRKQEDQVLSFSSDKLQFKGERSYFKKTMRLGQGQVYASPLNLNKEHGQIEEPIKPVVRFATPIFDAQQERRGMIIISILAQRALEQLAENQEEGNIYLIDNEGYFLLHHEKNKEWGRDLAHKTRIQYDYPEEIAQGLVSAVPYRTEYEGNILVGEPLFLSENRTYFLKIVQEYPKIILFKKVQRQTVLLIILGIMAVTISAVLSIFFAQSYIVQLVTIRNDIYQVIRGKNPQSVAVKGNDEIDQIHKNTNQLTESLYKMTEFAKEVGRGNYQADENFGSEVALGKALTEMRNDLQKAERERQINNWLAEGQNLFGNILRSGIDIQELTEQILTQLIKYLGLNQGTFFLLNQDTMRMDLMATYAWDRKKFLRKAIEKGEGTIGEVWQEGKTVYLKEVPQHYIRIKSGLGDTNPSVILISPIKNNDKILGIIELASFKTLKPYEIEFVERICEITGTAFASILNNFKTEKLLQETQEYTEILQSQEEEMRQNAEELRSTQEEMKRQIQDYEQKIDELQQQIRRLVAQK